MLSASCACLFAVSMSPVCQLLSAASFFKATKFQHKSCSHCWAVNPCLFPPTSLYPSKRTRHKTRSCLFSASCAMWFLWSNCAHEVRALISVVLPSRYIQQFLFKWNISRQSSKRWQRLRKWIVWQRWHERRFWGGEKSNWGWRYN